MKTSVRRGLFHPNDIKTAGLTPVSPSAKSAPLPDVLSAIGHSRTQSHPLNLVTPLAASPFTARQARDHTRGHRRSPARPVVHLGDRTCGGWLAKSSTSMPRTMMRTTMMCSESRMDPVRALFLFYFIFWYATLSAGLTTECVL
jgi:hypothetical protein